jgi:hypothetical protein
LAKRPFPKGEHLKPNKPFEGQKQTFIVVHKYLQTDMPEHVPSFMDAGN